MPQTNKKQKNFKHLGAYYSEILIVTIFLFSMIWLFFSLRNETQQDIVERIVNQELIGGSRQMQAIVIKRLLVNTWGKAGIMAVPVIGILGSSCFLYKEVFAYIRYIRKSRLYKKGLVFDLYDDYKPTPMLKRIKNLFSKAPKPTRRSYPTEKEMEEKLMKNKYYKKR